MSELAISAARGALEELLEVSPQVDAAVILERDGGRLLASAPPAAEPMSADLGDTTMQILRAAERARVELGREPVAQVEIATPDGHVFVVADTTTVVAAVTDCDPTVGLVFYDLKTALRSVREAAAAGVASSNGSSNGSGDRTLVTPLASSGSESAGAGSSPRSGEPGEGGDEGEGGSFWRRRKS